MTQIHKFISAEALLNMKLEKIPCLIEPIFPKVGLIAIAGSSDTGKSTLMRQLCLQIVTGADTFLGYQLQATHQRAIYVSTEDGKDAMASNLQIQNGKLGNPSDNYGNLNYLFDTSDLLPALEEMLEAQPHDLVVIDAFADIFIKDINQTNQVRSFLNDYSNLAERYECLIVFVHHTGKASETKAPSKNNLLGSQGFEAKMRMVVMLIKHPANIHLRYFCLVKGNYLPDHLKQEATELLFDENMIFSLTGNTQMMENLWKDDTHRYKNEQILKLHAEGISQSSIAKTLGLSQSTVSRAIGTIKVSPISIHS